MKKLFVALLMAVCILTAAACETRPETPEVKTVELSGTVTFAASPLSGVTVTAGEATATTDADGKYRFGALELKGYAVGFAKEGYVSQTIAVTAADFKDGKKVLDVAMKQEEILPGLTPADLESLAPIEGKLFEHSASVKTIDSAWNNKTVAQDGAFVDHGEGYCLEDKGSDAEGELSTYLYGKLNVTEENDLIKISARVFVREEEIYPYFGLQVVDAEGAVNKLIPIGKSQIWNIINTDAYAVFQYDLSEYQGQTVTVALGVNSGNHCAINRIELSAAADVEILPGVTRSELEALAVCSERNFTPAALYAWPGEKSHAQGFDLHNEGFCLQYMGENPVDAVMNTFIYNKFAVNEDSALLTVSARTFVGQNNGCDPYLVVKAVDETGSVTELVPQGRDAAWNPVNSDESVAFTYDLSAFSGKTVTLVIGGNRGYHLVLTQVELSAKA